MKGEAASKVKPTTDERMQMEAEWAEGGVALAEGKVEGACRCRNLTLACPPNQRAPSPGLGDYSLAKYATAAVAEEHRCRLLGQSTVAGAKSR